VSLLGRGSVSQHVLVRVLVDNLYQIIPQLLLLGLLDPEYTGCPRRNVRDFGRVLLMLNYTDITQNTYIQS